MRPDFERTTRAIHQLLCRLLLAPARRPSQLTRPFLLGIIVDCSLLGPVQGGVHALPLAWLGPAVARWTAQPTTRVSPPGFSLVVFVSPPEERARANPSNLSGQGRIRSHAILR